MKVKFNVKRYFQVLGISLAVIIAAAAVCMGIDFSGLNNEEAVDNTSTVEAADGKINVLLMGVDVDGLRTDAIMLASFDTETKEVNMLSIPRDTKMYIGNRYQKINAAHAFVDESGEIGGATATCEAVTRITGIPINYYVDFSFDAVAHVIDELGPIEFTIPDLYGDGVGMVYDDPVQSLHINLPPGDYQLNGQQAVWLMRYRHGNVNPSTGVFKGYVNGDSDRVEMQQKFLKAVVDQKVNASLILKIPSIFKDISSEIKTNFTVSEVIKYSKFIRIHCLVNIVQIQRTATFGYLIWTKSERWYKMCSVILQIISQRTILKMLQERAVVLHQAVYLQARQTLRIHQIHQIHRTQKAEVQIHHTVHRELRVHQAQVPQTVHQAHHPVHQTHHPVRHQIMKRPKKVREHQVLLTRVQAKDMNKAKNQVVNLRVLNTVAVKAMTAAMNNKDKITKKS